MTNGQFIAVDGRHFRVEENMIQGNSHKLEIACCRKSGVAATNASDNGSKPAGKHPLIGATGNTSQRWASKG